MKLLSLTIDNFREARSMDLRNLTDTTILTGPNGSCKTTALDALRVLFTGQCYDQAGKRIANEDLIGPHGKKAVIEAVMTLSDDETPFTLALAIKPSGTTLTAKDGRAYDRFSQATGNNQIRAALCEELGTDFARLECALNPRHYLLGADLGNILADLCVGEITEDAVKEAAGEHWPAVTRIANDHSLGTDAASLSCIGDAAYKRRTEVNKLIAIAERQIDDLKDIKHPTDTKGNPMGPEQLQPLMKLLNELQSKRDDGIAERGRLEALGSAEEIKAKRMELEGELARARCEAEVRRETLVKAESAYQENKEVSEKAGELLGEVAKAHRIASDKVDRAKEALAALKSEDGNCPTCGRKYTKALQDKLLKPLQEAIFSALGERDDIKIDAGRSDRDRFVDAVRQSAEQVTEASEAMKEIEATIASLDSALNELPDPATLPRIEDISAEIKAIEARCQSGREKVEALGKLAELEAARESHEALTKELGCLEWIVKAFRDGEFVKATLGDSKGEFEDACNAVLAPYEYSLSVAVEGKHVQVLLAREGHRAAPLAQCSKAELVLAGWAVATAFSDGCPICMDDMDALFGKTKNILLRSLAGRDQDSPVFVAGAWTAGDVNLEPLRAALPDASVVWVENGEAKSQGKAVAA